MKTKLKRFAKFYLNTWWFPPLFIAPFPLISIILVALVGWNELSVAFMKMYLFRDAVLISWGWLLAKKRYWEILWSFLLCVAIVLFCLSLIYLIPRP